MIYLSVWEDEPGDVVRRVERQRRLAEKYHGCVPVHVESEAGEARVEGDRTIITVRTRIWIGDH